VEIYLHSLIRLHGVMLKHGDKFTLTFYDTAASTALVLASTGMRGLLWTWNWRELVKNQSWSILKYYRSMKEPRYLNGIALGYVLADWRVRVQAGAGNFSLHHRVQTGSHPGSYLMGTRGSFPGG
jgi:hypothetical protein